MRGAAFLPFMLLAGSASAAGGLDGDRRRLAEAKADAAIAGARATELARAAKVERDAAARARTEEQAVAERVRAAEAGLAGAEARVRIVDALLARRRGELGVREAPTARLLGALVSLTRRPTIAALAQPGSIDDLVHLRAVLASVTPVVRARTARLRAELAETRRLRADAALAARALAGSRATLLNERRAFAALVASHQGRADALRRRALAQSDRAVALGETARDLVDRMDQTSDGARTIAALAALGEPPGTAEPATSAPPYRLPVAGRLVTGFGEVSANGVRARGLAFATAPGAEVVAPAAGRVAFARAFRGYGVVVIVDHGAGWRSALVGLGTPAVRVGQQVVAGERVGVAPGDQAPVISVELYRRGRPVDVAALVS